MRTMKGYLNKTKLSREISAHKMHPFSQSVQNFRIPKVSQVENRIKAFGPKRTLKDTTPMRNHKLKADLGKMIEQNEYSLAEEDQRQEDCNFTNTMPSGLNLKHINQTIRKNELYNKDKIIKKK
jgi:hypothetical protein